eukprot:1623017-Rhodomonas_salina.1
MKTRAAVTVSARGRALSLSRSLEGVLHRVVFVLDLYLSLVSLVSVPESVSVSVVDLDLSLFPFLFLWKHLRVGCIWGRGELMRRGQLAGRGEGCG